MRQFRTVAGMAQLLGVRDMGSDGFIEAPIVRVYGFYGCGFKDAQGGIPFQSK